MLRGWVRHIVTPDHPDLVLVYNFGSSRNMEKLLTELRSHTTADIIVGSLHWCRKHQKAWPDPETPIGGHIDPKTLRAVCQKYGVEFIETRRDITAYMLENNLKIADMLVDSVHQSPYMAKMINDSIAAHFNAKARFSYDPRSRERRIEAKIPNGRDKELAIEFTGSITGPDGKGNAFQPFTGKSGQITIPPDLWRLANTNKAGDSFTFEVKHSVADRIYFKGTPGKFRVCVADNLPNKPHKLILKTQDGGKVIIDAFDIFEPPLKSGDANQ